ncbi:MAG: helix-turn-helix domain-containing protein [bacterium]
MGTGSRNEESSMKEDSVKEALIEETLSEVRTISHIFFTVAEVAEVTRISYFSVLRLVSAGEITATKIGGQWRIPRTSLVSYLVKQSSGRDGVENDYDNK